MISSQAKDEVHAKCETVIITKHAKPVAKLVPVNAEKDEIYEGWGSLKSESPALRQGRNDLPQCVQILRVNHLGRRMRIP
jgi:antitoxin (DNA-binding transcriptional repressor) of toxin-antitoxin stability system